MAGAIAAQNRILQHFLKSGFEVKQGRNLNYIEFRNLGSVKANALEIPTDTIQGKNVPAEERVLVLMHGYGLGLAFFFANYDALLPHFDRIIAVDWRGMGASPWHCRSRKQKKKQV